MPPRRIPRLRPRFAGLGSLGSAAGDFRPGMPLPDGSPGSGVQPYDESGEVWGTMPGETQQGVSAPPQIPVNDPSKPTIIQPAGSLIQLPFGVSFQSWRNPTTAQSVPILSTTPGNVPVLSLNPLRNMLVIQNNSTATTAGDIAPTFYIGFNAQPQIGLALAILPGGGGILFDIICPRDAIFVAIGPSVNTGGSVVVQGSVVQGTYAPV